MSARLSAIALVSATVFPVFIAAQESRVDSAQEAPLTADFFVPRDQLDGSELIGLPEYCAGAYRWPALPYPLGVDDRGMVTTAEARAAQYLKSGEITLNGDVIIRRGNRTLRAAEVSLDRNTMIGRADAGVTVEEEDFIARGESGEINLNTSASQMENAEFLFKELNDKAIRGQADDVRQLENRNLQATRVKFTSCEPGNQTWQISARTMTIEHDEIFGHARDAVLRLGDVPVLYTPYISFPVSDERKSGWLFPTLAYSDVDGVDMTLPYYLNLAENYDATISPRWIKDRGFGVETEFRTLSDWQETMISGAFLPDDDLYDGTYTKDDWDDLFNQGLVAGEFEPEDRWLLAMDHRGRVGRVRTIVDYTAVSDRDYFRDLGTTLKVSSQRELERRGEALMDIGNLSLRLWAQRFDRTDDVDRDDYQRLPELALNYRSELPGPFEFSMKASASRFDRDNDDLVGLSRVVGDRYHFDPRLSIPFSRPWGFFNLTGGYRYTQYDLDDTEGLFDEEPDRTIGLGSVDTGLFFERDLNWFDTALVQTLEPRLYYLYQENEDQSELPRFDVSELTFSFNQLFRENRFAGLDRIGDANQLSTGLTSRFLKPATGEELFRASVGTIVYFEDRDVTIAGNPRQEDREDTSEIAGELAATVGKWSLTGSMIYDPHNNDVDEGGGYLQYRTSNDRIFNLGYRYRAEDDVDQTDFSFIWPLSTRYSLIGRWNYDIESGRTIEGMGGIEYNNCCWQVRAVGRRFIDSPSAREIDETEAEIGAFVQVVFKGLAGVGTKMESLLEKSIRGYRPEL
jgi:LPS-assembly protein